MSRPRSDTPTRGEFHIFLSILLYCCDLHNALNMIELPLLFLVCRLNRSRVLKYVLIGSLVVVLTVSSYFSVYYYSSYNVMARRLEGAALEGARGFRLSLSYAAAVLQSGPEPESIDGLIDHFNNHIHSAIRCLRALRAYLLPSYEDSFLALEDLLWSICAQGLGGVYDTFIGIVNVSVRIDAFKELNVVASEKISEMGDEVVEAFESLRSNHIVVAFSIEPSRIENAVSAANSLRTILCEWSARYLDV